MAEDQHSEPSSESVARAAQVAAMAAGVTEAVIRLRVQLAAEQAATDSQAAQAARAQRLADHAAARVTWSPAHDDSWLRQADTLSAAGAWGAARPWVDSDLDAARAMDRCEERLRDLHPDAMRRYDQMRAEGASPETAMHEAAPLFAQGRVTRTGSPTPRLAIAGEAADANTIADAERAAASAAGATRDTRATLADESLVADADSARHAGTADAATARAGGTRTATALVEEDYPRPLTDAISSAGTKAHRAPHTQQYHSSPRPQVR